MKTKTITILESCWLNTGNSGLDLSVEKEIDSSDPDNENPQFLCAGGYAFGICFSQVRIPLLKHSQIDAMIKMLTNARERITDESNSYTNETVEDPDFRSEE